ncbi:TPA: GerAB/ArcD/ProY family transporter [Bacillus anthracis]|uniref:GerAB/ArcD/ProY family transporter n=1 Tax=Bacillus TaxID=1386 RepID=UPI00003B273A|nr:MULTISPECIES: GerAB/ArcD/ProY family transporter [Bacillus]EXJ19551.1 spore germination protein [Bacillus anthracis str. 95014]AAT55236.1 spore germination protein [Bacillus anthracis str. Sterne]ACP14320.1 spore germination protein GerAB [Bacillus anthracis str. CDC 684]AFH84390.1 Spore germination protein GerAB [Bacillus anthracis str. H9401]AHE84559.1 spore gernimation protein [Bacillus anthracis str. A16R]
MITISKDRITTAQAVVIIVNYILGTGILTLPRASVEKVKTPDVWLSVILGGILAMVSGVIMVKLSQQFPDKTFYQYSQDIVGKWIGRLLSFLIIGYFLTTSAFQIRSMAEVISFFLLEGTPTWAIVMPFMWIGLYLIMSGINSIARMFEIIFPITFFIFLLISFMSIGIFEIDNLRPVLGLGIKPVLDGVVTRTWPTIDLMRSFEISGLIFERFESLLLVIWIMQIFATYTISYYAAALGLAQLFKKSIHPFIFALIPIIYIIAMTSKNINDLLKLGDMLGNAALFLFGLLPLLLLIIKRLKGGVV